MGFGELDLTSSKGQKRSVGAWGEFPDSSGDS